MKKTQGLCGITMIVGIIMISIGMVIQNEDSINTLAVNQTVEEFNIKNMAASTNMIVKESSEEEIKKTDNIFLTEVAMETAPASVIIPPRVEV